MRNAQNIKVYTDTNVLRYFGTAFANASLAAELRDHLLLSPLAVMELLSQLGTDANAEAYAAVQAFPRIHNSKATGMLAWPDNWFRMSIFGLPPLEDVITPALNNAVTLVLNSSNCEELKNDGVEMRALMDLEKHKEANQFSEVLNAIKLNGPLAQDEDEGIFARSIARQAGVDERTADIKSIVSRLNAFYIFEKSRLKIAAQSREYKVQKHANDVYDAEFLIYLSDPSLHLLTSDKGFGKAQGSQQFSRVHVLPPGALNDPVSAENTIRTIIST